MIANSLTTEIVTNQDYFFKFHIIIVLILVVQSTCDIGAGGRLYGSRSGTFSYGRSGCLSSCSSSRCDRGFRLGASFETGLQVVVVARGGLHISAFGLLVALFVVKIYQTVAFPQNLSRIGGIA